LKQIPIGIGYWLLVGYWLGAKRSRKLVSIGKQVRRWLTRQSPRAAQRTFRVCVNQDEATFASVASIAEPGGLMF
jgi:hypothetical protein